MGEPPREQMARRMAEMQRENEMLSQQVKRLIRAESRLYEFQQELDAQLKEYKDLYHLHKKLFVQLDLPYLGRVATEYVTRNLNYERALFLELKESGRYGVTALEGYFGTEERERVMALEIDRQDPFLAPLLAGAEYLFHCRESESVLERDYCTRFDIDDFLVYPLAVHPVPQALLVAGNRASTAEFYRKVSDSNGTLVTMGNFIGLISSSIENYIAYHKLEELSQLLEKRVRETVDEARQKDKILISQGRQAVMGEMISNIAHQWRQPLNMLGLLAQDMQLTKELGDLSKEYIDAAVSKMMQIIQQMSKTIDDFRNFFKPDKEKVPFRAADAVDRTVGMLEGSFRAAQIRIRVDRNGDPVVCGYPGEFTQVLLNILVNARDALVSRKVPGPQIHVAVHSGQNRTRVSITDNAGGIPEEIIDKIFEPYFTTKGPDQGTGIGLFMCKNIIEKNMQGVLTARNVEGGAQFVIEV